MTADCPRAKSSMTPCVLRDGKDALADDGACVGCLALMTTSESPTHPDAPRADGEIPMIDPKRIAADAVQRLADSEPDEDAVAAMDRLAGTPQESMFCVSAPALEGVIEVAIADALFDASRASLLARHRDGERDTRLLDWLTASCRDLIHSEGGKWEVIEYPGDPLVEERRAIGNTPREALIVAGALRVAHPYDAISVTPPAASDGTWVDIERIKPNCMPPLFDEKRPPAASPEPTVNSNDR